jgi:hypothetical protein
MGFAALFSLPMLVSAQTTAQPTPAASSWLPEPSEVPKTKAGECVQAYVAAFNAGEQAIREFESARRSEAALKERSVDSRVESYRSLKQQWGTLKVHCVVDAEGEERIGVLIQTTPSAQWLACDFQFDAPGKLKAIQIDGPVELDEIRQRIEPIDQETRDLTVKAVIHALNTSYVFPEVAAKMGEAISANAAAGKYDAITSAPRFAQLLTDDLRGICHDKHLRVRLAPSGGGEGNMAPRNPASDARKNYGFEKAEVLAGNIGYIKFNGFDATDEARQAAAAAMAVVADCDAVIFDLRENGGGSPRMIEFLGGYLYEQPTVLNAFYDRKGKRVSQTKTMADGAGQEAERRCSGVCADCRAHVFVCRKSSATTSRPPSAGSSLAKPRVAARIR